MSVGGDSFNRFEAIFELKRTNSVESLAAAWLSYKLSHDLFLDSYLYYRIRK